MRHPMQSFQSSRLLVSALIGCLSACLLIGPSKCLAEAPKLDNSLQWIPADAAFYSASLRNREQVEAVLHSKAWAKLTHLPAVQMAWQMASAQLHKADGPMADLIKLYQMPENQQLVQVLSDMGSDEIFIYGGKSFIDLTEVCMGLASEMRFQPFMMGMTGVTDPNTQSQQMARIFLRALSQHTKQIKIPDLIIGFKITNLNAADAQIKRLEEFLAQIPPVHDLVARKKVAGSDFLTLNLDGKMVPWQQIPLDKIEQTPGEFNDLIGRLADLKMTVSIGVKDKYLLIALGESLRQIEHLGGGKHLTESPELKPLLPFGDRRLTSINYLSKALHARVAASKTDVDGMVSMANGLLARLGLPTEMKQQIGKDLKGLARDIKTFIPEVGAELGFSFLTDRGQESYSYSWGDHPEPESSKPLTLLNHVGGQPLLAVVSRKKYSPEQYQMLVKWLKVANRYFEQVALPQASEMQKEQYEKITKFLHPALKRLDETTSQKLLPAFADGQSAFVIDAKITSRQWVTVLPAAGKAVPMIEPALVFGVSDAVLLKDALREYREIANELIAKARELAPEGSAPEFQIPEPETHKIKTGTLYFYALPEMVPVDRKLLPNAGLSQKVAVLSISEAHSERLLARNPLQLDGGPLADLEKPRAGAVYVNCAGMVDAISPWIDFGLQIARPFVPALGGAQGEDSDAGAASPAGDIVKQVHTVLEVLKVFRSYSSSTYIEGSAEVTHSESVIKDL